MTHSPAGFHPRARVYYWKCDRPAAFHGTDEAKVPESLVAELQVLVAGALQTNITSLQSAGGQGNHLTFAASTNEADYFIRVEDGPEQDDYMDVETHLLKELPAVGVPVPKVFASDATRRSAPFAWQVLEMVAAPDLNLWHKRGELELPAVAEQIGRDVAAWQSLRPQGFGLFDVGILRRDGRLAGYHEDYVSYFFLNLRKHLSFLVTHEFLRHSEADAMLQECRRFRDLLELRQGCLVHKDLALWNILGSKERIAAYIDWDDAISGDPMDDFSLLGCFYEGSVVERAVRGYCTVHSLPEQHHARFWLHLLRNMIVKSVIRVGAGHFDRDDRFFLLEPGLSGGDFRKLTQTRLLRALEGLQTNAAISEL